MRASTLVLALAAAAVLAGCGGSAPPAGEAAPPAPAAAGTTAEAAPPPGPPAAPRRVDPRDDGLEIALGEWALSAESLVIRPGRVTFLVVNRGQELHGFEIESEERRDDNGDRIDRDERFKHETRVLRPGESAELTLDLPAGVYKIECLVDGHDDLGMEEILEVRADAPLAEEAAPADDANAVRIAGFAYEPETIEVSAGESVTWTNEDEAGHTVTHEGGEFGSKTLGREDGFRVQFDRRGTFRYLCALHPEMRGTVVVR